MLDRLLAGTAAARARLRPGDRPREALVAGHAPGRSVVDVGCMWTVDGAIAFAAADAGARSVTGVDVSAPTPAFRAGLRERADRVRFVRGDLHDPATVAEVGPHDVVWCSGVVYHAPHPVLTLERLRELCAPGGVLLLASETIPEVPGLPRACTFRPRQGAHPGIGPADETVAFAPWWWGITPSALRAMTEAAGFRLEAEHGTPHHRTLVARPA